MRRVYVIWILREMESATAMKTYAIGALILAISQYVSFGNVILNAPQFSDMEAWAAFASAALLNTEIVVQTSMLAIAAFGVWVFRDIAMFRHPTGMASGA